MIEFELKSNKYKVDPPKSLATCLEFITLWSNEDPVVLLRLCAGAIGVALDSKAIYPAYKPLKHDPISYGRIMLERLLDEGVQATQIYKGGSASLVEFAKQIPTEQGVEDKANFTPSQPEGG